MEMERNTQAAGQKTADSAPPSADGSAYRLPADTRVGAVRLQVADLERSLAFYRDIIGLEPRERAAGRTLLAPPGAGETLVELRERAGARPAPRGGRPGLYHFAILLPDRVALGHFLAHLGRMGARVGMADHLVSEAIYLSDPDGLGIEVYADRPRASWRRRGPEVAMATDPLNVRDLLQAAGEIAGTELAPGPAGAWRMPAGTRIGHLHLHVGDLAVAEAFYRAGLGLDVVVRSYPGALFLSAGGYHHHLGVNTWATRADPAGEEDARLLEWELLLPRPEDVATVADRLIAAGHEVARDEDGFRVPDPWGTVLRVRVA